MECEICGKELQKKTKGPAPKYCSASHKNLAYLRRIKAERDELRTKNEL
jgi:hypothetical protein